MTLMRKFLRESWVVLLPVLLSFLMTFYSIVEDIRLYDITSCCFNQ